jgi:UPF0716 protein FxsA
LLFILYPALEIMLWWKFISNFGFGDAVLWCILSAIVGFYVLRLQGAGAVEEFQRSAQSGAMPSHRIAHRILMGFGGFLLILPGMITDLAGALLVLPGVRHLLVWFLYKKMADKLVKGFGRPGTMGSFGFAFKTGGFGRNGFDPNAFRNPGSARPTYDPNVIDVQAQVIEDDQPQLQKPKGPDNRHSESE